MRKAQPARVQELPTELGVWDAVGGIAHDGKFDRGQVNSDLVRAAGLEPDREQRVFRQEAFDLEVRDRLAWRVRIERPPQRVVTVAADRRLDPAGAGPRPAADERQVAAVERSLPNEVLEPGIGLLGTGDDQQPRGVAVETMDDAGALRYVAARDPAIEQRLHQRPARVARGRMDDDSGGLVDDEQVLVLVCDSQIACLWLEDDVLPFPGVHLHQLSAQEAVALGPLLAVDPHCPAREQALGLGARGDLRHRGDEPVEALAGSVSRNAETDRQRRVSPSRIAAKRMPTPTTMKVSARLNAGQ